MKSRRKLLTTCLALLCVLAMLGEPMTVLASAADSTVTAETAASGEEAVSAESEDTQEEDTKEEDTKEEDTQETDSLTQTDADSTDVDEEETADASDDAESGETKLTLQATTETVEEETLTGSAEAANADADETDSDELEPEASADGVLANSWRFTDGIWSGALSQSISLNTYAAAWEKNSSGNYVSSNGSEIEGALYRGIDVSKWQGEIDWEEVIADDVSFAIIKCYGAGEDSRWDDNASECERLGLVYGAYVYVYATSASEAAEDAQEVLEVLEGYSPQLPIYLDMEDDSVLYKSDGTMRTSAELAAIAEAFAEVLEDAGYTVSVYANKNWWTNYLTDSYFDQFDETRWVAQYNSSCTYSGNYMIWQCSSTGSIDGIDGNVDIDFIYTDVYFTDADSDAVEAFVTRLYELLLGREPDSTGLQSWSEQLTNKTLTAAEVVQYFIESEEYTAMDTSDEDYVEALYLTCLDRASDAAGKAGWLAHLTTGFSRTFVLKYFVESDEFTQICADYSVKRGTITLTQARDMNMGVTQYVSRCYNILLGRAPDVSGLNNWTQMILSDADAAKKIPYYFITSEEFIGDNYSDTEFVTLCYQAILGREPDSGGLTNWVNHLAAGKSRTWVCEQFTSSAEFKQLLAGYGL